MDVNSADTDHNILKWLHENRHKMEQYRNQYIAYNANGVIANGKELEKVLESVNKSGKPFAIYFVPRHSASSVVILPVRLRSVSRHEWKPNYLVRLKHGDIEIPATMLVDSGADFSVISKKTGRDLGYALADAEQTLVAHGIGGTADYVLRNIEMTIEGHSFTAPVAWIQDDNCIDEMILGREIVFDKFNIEFRQAEEKILFYWRET
ncbi:MAG: hypothetical protein GY795_19740 [Desulfobacterales bacterium]|nr:hypothetical protein [Desulfobacterales bacterium]